MLWSWACHSSPEGRTQNHMQNELYLCNIFSFSARTREATVTSAIYAGKRAGKGSTVFPCQSDMRLSESTSPISIPGFCFSSESFRGAHTVGGCLRLAFCTTLHSSALRATTEAWRLQLRNKFPGQTVMLMYQNFKGYIRKTSMNLQMGKFHIITPGMLLTLRHVSVCCPSSMAVEMRPLLARIYGCAAQRCSQPIAIHYKLGTCSTCSTRYFSCLCKSWPYLTFSHHPINFPNSDNDFTAL